MIMTREYAFLSFAAVIAILALEASSQNIPRLNIPGAIPLDGPRPRRIQAQGFGPGPVPIRRKPISNAIPLPSVRPVVEEHEEQDDQRESILDEEVARLTSSAFNSVRPAQSEEQEERDEAPRPLPFRPEARPIPVARENVREAPRQQPNRQEAPRAPARPPVRQAVREQYQRPKNAPPFLEDEEEGLRRRKPTVQILRKYRTDNEDGSITWGFENEDGTFKEENIGADCIIRGKYGYVDPTGEKREFEYEAGNKCDEPEEEEELELDLQSQNLPRNRPDNSNVPASRPQYRPQYKPVLSQIDNRP